MTQVFDLNNGTGKKIKEAAQNRFLLQITYIDAKNRPSIRTIEPYEIKEGKLYGYCRAKEAIRAFKLDSIQSAEVTAGEFIPRFPVLI